MWKSIKVQNVVVSSSVIWSDRLTIINNNSCQLVDWYIRRVMIVSFFLILAGCKWNTSTWRSKKWSAPFTRRTNRQGNLLILQTSWLICLLSLWSVSKEFWDCFLCSCYHLYNLWNNFVTFRLQLKRNKMTLLSHLASTLLLSTWKLMR